MTSLENNKNKMNHIWNVSITRQRILRRGENFGSDQIEMKVKFITI